MNIKSKQIIEEIELKLNKFIEEISTEELNTIDNLTINEFDMSDKKEEFFIEDLLLFKNLKSISFNNKIIDLEIMNYILNSSIEELNLYNCEFIYEPNIEFNNIKTLRIEYVDNFKEEYLKFFPNVENLSFKGYTLNNKLSKNIKILDLMNSKINNTNIFDNSNINEIFISKDEYEDKKEFYSNLLIKVNVYDENNCYLLNRGDEHE